MKPVWLVEADVFREASEPLKAEVRRQRMACHVVAHRPGAAAPQDVIGDEALPGGAPVVFRGSHPLMRHVQLTRRWVSVGWCNFDGLACSSYYPHFRDYLLNREHATLPAAAAVSGAAELFDRFGRDGRLFVRPDGVVKTFTGRLVDRDGFVEALGAVRYQPDAAVVVAPPREIGREWRVVVCRDMVVAASLYRDGEGVVMTPGCPRDVERFAADLLARVGWRPDPVFILDVCESGGALHVVELNSFSCSGLYPCDPAAVVAAASEAAASEAAAALRGEMRRDGVSPYLAS